LAENLKHLRFWLPLICAVALAACSHSQSATPAAPQPDGQSAPAAQQDGFGLPAPSVLLVQQANRDASGTLPDGLHRDGSEFEADLPHNLVHGLEQFGVFEPDWEPGSGLAGAAYCIYRLTPGTELAGRVMRVKWKQQNDREKLWVGLADFSTDNWQWRHALDWSDSGEIVPAEMIDPGTGSMYVVFVMLGQQIAGLDYVEVIGTAWDRYWAVPDEEAYLYVEPLDLELDQQNNLIVAGRTRSLGDEVLVLLKYDQDGYLLWQVAYHGPLGSVLPGGFELDSNGNMYVGLYNIGSSYTMGLIKLDPDGNLLWQKRLGTDYCGFDSGMAVDAQGGVLVSGAMYDDDHYRVCTVRRINPDGSADWARKYKFEPLVNPDSTPALQLVGNQMYFASEFYVSDHHPVNPLAGDGVVLVKADQQGAVEWARSWHKQDSIQPVQLRVSESGSVVLACDYGWWGDFEGEWEGLFLIFTPAGGLMASQTWGRPDRWEWFCDLELQAGSAYVTGVSSSGYYSLIEFDEQGHFVSAAARQYNSFSRMLDLGLADDGWQYLLTAPDSMKISTDWEHLDLPAQPIYGEVYDWECNMSAYSATTEDIEGYTYPIAGRTDFEDYEVKWTFVALSKCAL
jgi:hypothetical protein